MRHLAALLSAATLAWPALPALAAVDLVPYDRLLHDHVSNASVDYRALARPPQRRMLRDYLAAIADAPEPKGRADGLAAWINAYNALVIDGILDGKSPETFVGRSLFFFTGKQHVYGRDLTLSALEDNKIRKGFNDPRIHAAIVCASKSCPPLRAEAYIGQRIEAQLDDQMTRFLHDPTKNRFDRAHRTLELSPIFKWFKDDFTAVGGVPSFIARYLATGDRAWLTGADVKIKYLEYDWSLNGHK